MPYVGNSPAANFASVTKDSFSGDGSTTAFTLSKAATTNGVAVFVENVRQEPTTAYAVSGTTLTFTAAPVSASGNNIYVLHHNTPASTATHPAGQDLTAANATLTGAVTVGGTSNLTITDGDLVVGTSGHGISFAATSDGTTMDNELFDDYEEGSWTWTLTDGSNNATAQSGGWDTGYYRKIGGLAYVTAYIRISSLGSVSGDAKITGLPFTSMSGNTIGTASGFACGRMTNANITAGHVMGYQVGAGSSEVLLRLWDDTGGTTAMQASELSGDVIFIMTVIYPT